MSGNGRDIGEDLYNDSSIPNKLVQLQGDAVQGRLPWVSSFAVYGDAIVAPVPEPATWAMMIFGMGAVGATMRRRKRMRAILHTRTTPRMTISRMAPAAIIRTKARGRC